MGDVRRGHARACINLITALVRSINIATEI